MKLSFLHTLQVVLQKGSFAAASAEIGLTPSAVSQQMQQLETYFGQLLFDRSQRIVRPTRFAREVVTTMAGTLSTLQDMRVRRTPVVSGQVKIGVINSVQLSILPQCLLRLRDSHPQLGVVPSFGTSEQLLHQLKSGDLDLVVVVRPAGGGSHKLSWRDLHKDPFVLLAPPQSADLAPRHLVRALPWIRYNYASSGGKLASGYVRKLSPGLRPAFEVQSTDAIVGMVSAGLGFSVLPQPRAPLLRAYPAREVRLDRQIRQRQISVACRRPDAEDRRIGAVTQSFAQVCEGFASA